MEHLDRIVHQAGVMGGKPCVRGTRVTVGLIVGQIAAGHSLESILSDYPYLLRMRTSAKHCATPPGALKSAK
jgi:uncharacterized protein (DUF433 family)